MPRDPFQGCRDRSIKISETVKNTHIGTGKIHLLKNFSSLISNEGSFSESYYTIQRFNCV